MTELTEAPVQEQAPVTEAEPVAPTSDGLSRSTAMDSTPEAVSNEFKIPEAYQEKGWTKNIKSIDDVFKQFDDAQSMIGKKNIPNSESPDEEWETFYNQMRPESADKYELTAPEGVEIDRTADSYKQAQQMFHDAGLSPKQADKLYNQYISNEIASQGQLQQTPEQTEQEFNTKMGEVFGDKANEALKNASRYMSTLDEATKAGFEALPNDQFVAVISALDLAAREQNIEGKMPSGEGSSNSGKSVEELRKEVAGLRSSKEARDPLDPKYSETRQRIKELDDKLIPILNKQ